MTIFLDSLIIILLFALFGISHSILASFKFKRKLIEKIGDSIAFYRLFYNISSIIIFVALYAVAPKPDIVIYDLNFPFDVIIVSLQIISIGGLIWAVKYINLKEFLGIDQIKRYLEGSYKIEDLDERTEFVVKGPFKYSRHPIYLFSTIFLILRPTMDLWYLIMLLCIFAYFYIGSYYEEKKLVERFGVEYTDYQKNVPRFFPKLF